MVTKKIKYIAYLAVLGGIALTILNSYTIVQDGEAKTERILGVISDSVYRAGFHIVNPIAKFTTFDIKENNFKLDNVTIPSQDKFKSAADITVQWSIQPERLPSLQRKIGTQRDIQDKILVQPLLSILREVGREVPKAQDLFIAEVQDRIQGSVLDQLIETAAPYGITIHAVYIKDITLPDVITKSIITTKQLEEQEAQEKARLKQQELIYARQTAEAAAAAKSAEQQKIAAEHRADAEQYAVEAQADAKLYSNQKEAEGNIALAKSVTKELLQLKALEIQLQEANNWKGGCTTNCTSFGDEKGNSGPIALYHMGDTAQAK